MRRTRTRSERARHQNTPGESAAADICSRLPPCKRPFVDDRAYVRVWFRAGLVHDVQGNPIVSECKTCGRQTDDLYPINGWLVCYNCVRGRPFWELLRASCAAESSDVPTVRAHL